jgi:transposase-like protein
MNGKNASGQQRYKCKDCGVTWVLNSIQKSKLIDTELVVTVNITLICCNR